MTSRPVGAWSSKNRPASAAGASARHVVEQGVEDPLSGIGRRPCEGDPRRPSTAAWALLCRGCWRAWWRRGSVEVFRWALSWAPANIVLMRLRGAFVLSAMATLSCAAQEKPKPRPTVVEAEDEPYTPSTEGRSGKSMADSEPSTPMPSTSKPGEPGPPAHLPGWFPPVGEGWWCYQIGHTELPKTYSFCMRTQKQCLALRSGGPPPQPGVTVAPCLQRPAAACFTYHSKLTDSPLYSCHDSLTSCALGREHYLAKPLDYDSVSTCGAYP